MAACGRGSADDEGAGGGGSGGSAATGGGAGSGGSSGAAGDGSGGNSAGGSGGAAGATASCINADPEELPGRVTGPSPLISVGKPVTASANVLNPGAVVDGAYKGAGPAGFGRPTEDAPEWIAIDLGTGPTRVLLMWSDAGNQFTALTGGAPGAYHIETSADSTDGSDGTWTEVARVMDNPYRIREHAFDFTGQRWVRLVVTATPTENNVRIDEIAVHDLSASGSERPSDSWFFMGDSITQGAFARGFRDNDFDAVIKAERAEFDPIVVGAGVGGELASHGRAHIDDFLSAFPDIEHFAIMYGTNDSWGDKALASTTFESDMAFIVQSVIDAGRTPILAAIPYSTFQHSTLPQFNAAVERIRAEHGLPCGPDFYAEFEVNAEWLSADGVHPSQTGYQMMNRLWAETVGVLYPSN